MFTKDQYLMGRDKDYPLTEELKTNTDRLLIVIESFFSDLNYSKPLVVSSGYRPEAINSAIGGAKKSAHSQCLAVDILDDKSQNLANLVKSRPDLLRKYNLFMENPMNTIGKWTNWVHLDLYNRPDRPSRIFNP